MGALGAGARKVETGLVSRRIPHPERDRPAGSFLWNEDLLLAGVEDAVGDRRCPPLLAVVTILRAADDRERVGGADAALPQRRFPRDEGYNRRRPIHLEKGGF